MVRIRVPEKDLVLLVMGHLHRTGLIKSLRALEKETVLNLVQYGKDVLFFRDLVMDGRWEEAQLFIEPLKDSAFDHGRVNFFLDRQRFLELADQHCANADVKEMVAALKALEGRCSQEEFHSLCYCLTLPSLKKHPDFGEWDVYRGRLSCFESCLSHLRTVFPDQVPPGDKVQLPGGPNDPLVTMCRQALLFQVQQYRRADASRLLPEELTADVFSETIEGSLARSQPCPSTHTPARTNPRARRSHEQQQQLDDVTFQSDVPATAAASAARSEPLRANGVGGHGNGLQVNGRGSATEEVIDGRRSAPYAYEERTQSAKAILPQDPMWSRAAQGPTTHVRRAPGSESERRPQVSNPPAPVPCQADDRPAAHASGPGSPPPKPLAWDITFEDGNVPLAPAPSSMSSRPQQPPPRGQDCTAPPYQQQQQQASSLPPIIRSSSTQSHTSVPPPPPRPNPAASPSSHPAGTGDALALTAIDVPQRHSGTDSVDSQHADVSRARQEVPQQAPPPSQPATRDNGSHHPTHTRRRTYRDLEAGDVEKIAGGRSLVTDSHPIRAAVLDSTGCRLVYGSNSGALKICDVAAAMGDGDEQEGGGGGPVTILHERFKHVRGSVYSLSWSSDDSLIASGSNDKAVRVVRAIEGAHEGQDVVLQGHTGTVRDVCFSPAGPMLLSAGGGDFALRLWDVSRGRAQSPLMSLKLHTGTVFRSRFASGDGHTAVSGGEDGVVAWWDVRSGQAVSSLKVLQGAAVQGLAPLMGAGSGGQEGVMVATSHADGTICVWDRRRVNAPVASLKAFSHDCRTIALSPDGRWLVGGSYDHTIAVLGVSLRRGGDVAAAAQSGVLSKVASRVGHKGKVLSMVWHPRLPAFVSSGSDGAVMVWKPV